MERKKMEKSGKFVTPKMWEPCYQHAGFSFPNVNDLNVVGRQLPTVNFQTTYQSDTNNKSDN